VTEKDAYRRSLEDEQIEMEAKKHQKALKKARMETVRNRAILLWAGSLTVMLVLATLAIVFWSRTFSLLILVPIAPVIIGLAMHSTYLDRIMELEGKPRG